MISSFRPTRTTSPSSLTKDHVTSDQPAMSNLDTAIQDLVIANRILAREEVVDAYGHVSIRNPDNPKHFFLARSLAPELAERHDIVELGLDGQPVRDEKRALYLERFIHAAIYEARPDIHSVVHAHAEDILPFGIAQATPLRPVIHSGSFIGANVPVWDIADKFGDTNVLVSNMAQARDLGKCLAKNNVALMRAKQLGGRIKYLSQGEIDARNRGYSPYSTETWRAWEYWANKAGCGHLLTRPGD